MKKLCVFAGTSEGRLLIEALCKAGAEVTACVATEYGKALLPECENLCVSAQRLSAQEIRTFLTGSSFALVIDATHPYAANITKNVCSSCKELDIPYLRLQRESSPLPENAVRTADMVEAAAYLARTSGNILLTTGTRDLAAFSSLEGFSDRVYARILPMEESLAACREAGLAPSHVLAMQGPFSEEMNAAMMRSVNAAYVVTKESGTSGGFAEKAAAAEAAGAELVVVGRPPQPDGCSLEQVFVYLEKKLGISIPLDPDMAGLDDDITAGNMHAAKARTVTHGLPDEAFLRADHIPMTKSEIRSVCISKLALTRNAVCWDIGAGTGSVAIEMALQADHGQVFAIEQKEEAVSLIYENARRLGADNLVVVHGTAPEACKDLPAPDFAFIGGSSGNMEQIVELLLEKNPHVRIAATAVTLETVSALTQCMTRFAFEESQILTIQVSRGKKTGPVHLMMAQNPVTVFALQKHSDR